MASGEGQDIHIEELKKLQGDPSVLIIDVREKSEIAETGVLPGGINIPLGELSDALEKSPTEFTELYHHAKPEKDTKIVFSCRSGRRSLAGLNIAKKLGFTKYYYLLSTFSIIIGMLTHSW
ncbi:hypothetical protein AAG570_002398 [Ranatra chinensis]|uniref:Rhodanese domain-containing protein n=1 Tax=Ranatra chinensis TaxID=642074 RepID=A0ABD0YJP6_9HEMI